MGVMHDDVEPGQGRRGRPTVLDADAAGRAALELWAERGYADVGWEDISEACGVSVRTLTRHFPSKASLAWVGVGRAADLLRAALAAQPASSRLADAVRAAVVACVGGDGLTRRYGPSWLRLLAEEPDLMAAAHEAFAPWTSLIDEFVASRLPAPAAVRHGLAQAYQSATLQALTDWATNDPSADPAQKVDEVLQWIDVRVPESALPLPTPKEAP